jgi:hypothetical protein
MFIFHDIVDLFALVGMLRVGRMVRRHKTNA